MRCRKIKKILGAYLDGELSEKKNLNVHRHLEECSACSWELKSFQKIDELGKWRNETDSPQLPEGYWDNFSANLNAKLKQTTNYQQSNILDFFTSCLRFTQAFFAYWFKKIAPGLAAMVVIAILIMGINYVRDRFFRIVQPEDSIRKNVVFNFYLKEHEKAVTEVDYSIPDSPSGIELGYEDLFYYNVIRGSDRVLPGEAGIILRAPHHSSNITPREPSRAKNIVNGKKLSLQEAREAVGFKIVASQTLYPGYFLESIKKIEKEDYLQLIYTNGLHTLSLFEQALGNEKKYRSDDFREYVLYSGRGRSPVNILGWNSVELSFTLIGEEDLSRLMGIIREIQEEYLGNKNILQ